MLRFSDALALNTPAIGSRTCVQTQFIQIYNTLGGSAGQKAALMTAAEAQAVAALGLPVGTTVDWGGCCATAKSCVKDKVGTIDWAALWAALEPILAMLLPILIPLL